MIGFKIKKVCKISNLRLNFRVVRAQPVDLFPLTPHHELVFLLLRGEARKRFEERESVKDVKAEAAVKNMTPDIGLLGTFKSNY